MREMTTSFHDKHAVFNRSVDRPGSVGYSATEGYNLRTYYQSISLPQMWGQGEADIFWSRLANTLWKMSLHDRIVQ